MLFSNNLTAYPVLFQSYQPTKSQPVNSDNQNEYLDLPSIAIVSYEELMNYEYFNQIKTQFLGDIKKLKQLVKDYKINQYDNDIDEFYKKIENPTIEDYRNLLAIYMDTRYQIHRMITKIKEFESSGYKLISRDEIICILHNCLESINNCLGGIHSRFMMSYLALESVEDGLAGTIFKVRSELFHEFIDCYLFEKQRDGILKIDSTMEIHWKNGLYNLLCKNIALDSISDTLANQNFTDRDIKTILSALLVKVNAYTILERLADNCFEKLCTCLKNHNLSNWLASPVQTKEMTPERLETLEIQVFTPTNLQLQVKNDKHINIWTIADEDKNTNNLYHFDRSREKLQIWMTAVLLLTPAKVFTTLSDDSGTYNGTCIGTIDDLVFWVFNSSQQLKQNSTCYYDPYNHISLQLHHLQSINLASYNETTRIALLSQAIKQSNDPKTIANFFLNSIIFYEWQKTYPQMIQIVGDLLTDKLQDTKLTHLRLKEHLVEAICKHFSLCEKCDSYDLKLTRTPTQESTSWFINTPLLASTLCKLKDNKVDIINITDSLSTWKISDFSLESINKCLTSQQCKTLFSETLRLNQIELMEKLLLSGHCDNLANKSNNDKQIPLILLSINGFTGGIKHLLSIKDIDINYKDSYGKTALMHAAECERVNCIDLLIKHHANVNEQSNFGWTALMFAARFNSVKSLRFLLETTKGSIDINKKSFNGRTAMLLAAKYDNTTIVQLLLDYDSSESINASCEKDTTALMLAISNGSLNTLTCLLEYKADINKTNNKNNTALMLASYKGYWECIQLILENTYQIININYQNDDKNTALMLATLQDHKECVRLLLNYKALAVKINTQNNLGNSALILAAEKNTFHCMELLVKHPNININDYNKKQMTALGIASKLGNLNCVQCLIQHSNISINIKNTEHCHTALSLASQQNHINCVKLLLKRHNIQTKKKDLDRWTSLNHTQLKNNEDCIQLLLNHGATNSSCNIL